ncbi:MAG: hypothetical protein IH964_11085 [Candidatus Dadabacteria bacterium]|nr:hypothetical protein [Candidatus Dadabacteria bacterium]
MSKKKVIAKLTEAKNQYGSIQKKITVPKQKETEDWEKGDLIELKKMGDKK